MSNVATQYEIFGALLMCGALAKCYWLGEQELESRRPRVTVAELGGQGRVRSEHVTCDPISVEMDRILNICNMSVQDGDAVGCANGAQMDLCTMEGR